MFGELLVQLAAGVVHHLGELHAYEHVLVWLLAFGPVLLLAVTIHVARKRDREDDDA